MADRAGNLSLRLYLWRSGLPAWIRVTISVLAVPAFFICLLLVGFTAIALGVYLPAGWSFFACFTMAFIFVGDDFLRTGGAGAAQTPARGELTAAGGRRPCIDVRPYGKNLSTL